MPTEMDELYAGADALEPEGWSYWPDNMWTNPGPTSSSPPSVTSSRRSRTTSPTSSGGRGAPELPDMAFSVQASLYIAAFAAWNDDGEEAVRSWGVDHIRRLEPFSEGIQLADENLVERPHARYLSGSQRAPRGARARVDPGQLFHGYLTGS